MNLFLRNARMLRALLTLTFVISVSAQAQSWPQWMANARHTGTPGVTGQSLIRILADIVYDPTVPQEQAASGGFLLAHYQVPLIDGERVFMEFKSGTIFPFAPNFSTLNWGEKGFEWKAGKLVETWAYQSNWKAPGSLRDFWEPVFHAALANGGIYVPMASGGIAKLDKNTGAVLQQTAPFGQDVNTYQTGPLTVDKSGNIYYNVIQIFDGSSFGGSFYSFDAIDSFLVKVTPQGVASMVSYKSLTAADATENTTGDCLETFSQFELPWPPGPTASPVETFHCGTQRIGLNVAPAIGADGTIYGVTRSHFNSRYAFLVAIKPNLTKKWVSSLRSRFNDGCGVPVELGGVLPPNGTPGGCREGAPLGVDPSTNRPGDGEVNDSSSSSPVVGPDGAIFYGAFSRYNYDQGHMMKFNANGKFAKAYGFGWDQTPVIFQRDDDSKKCGGACYSLVIKENRYGGIGSYCDNFFVCPPDRNAANPASPEAYYITQLDQNMSMQWQFKGTNTQSCNRNPDGTLSCVSDHPNGFEWCVNGHLVDANGVVYANSEDGNLYAISQGGILKEKIFQQLALGAAYTPASMDIRGRIYSQNAGHLFVIGR